MSAQDGRQARGFCKHYVAIIGPGMVANRECEKGVNYLKHAGCDHAAQPGWIKRLPCFGDRSEAAPCEHREMPTREEEAAEERDMIQTVKMIGDTRRAIRLTHLKAGKVDCPKCGGTETVAFTVSDYNGHIHAQCRTEGCTFGWME